ncbi:MAG: DUF5714 domain-containing protein [Promethearchaeota archaeon]
MKDKCNICGQELEYATNVETCITINCDFCGNLANANIFCPNGHYVCDICHSKGAIEIIEQLCESSIEKDPFTLADQIMKHPKFKMYGPEHHVLTPAVLLTSLKNNNIKKTNGQDITKMDIKETIKRASKIPGGWCGFYGSCGAGMGSGVAISVFTGATPAKDKERTLANKMTSKALNKIADNLEHCCKRSVRISICEALSFLQEEFGISLNYNPKKCEFSRLNDKCETQKCPFFG